MVKCPKCKSDDYDVLYIEECAYKGSEIITLVKVKCCECGKEFWVTEYFVFDTANNTL